MQDKHLMKSDAIYQYVRQEHTREDGLLQTLREETEQMVEANCQISPDQGAFMSLIVQAMNAVRAIEVGTFTGYSSICIARALPVDGRLVCCDVNEDWTGIAKEYWQKAGVAGKVELHLRPALETLDELIAGGESGGFDFAFIDADKITYDDYYERTLTLLRSGGVMMLDNSLRDGRVVDVNVDDPDTVAIREINKQVLEDERVDAVMLTIADGIYMTRKR